VLVVGPIYALIYYGVFRLFIEKLDLMTPGRDREDAAAAPAAVGSGDSLARQLVLAFGGRRNIKSLDACITRLRVEVHDVAKASPERLKALGAAGVMNVGKNLQAVFGTRSENLKSDMETYLKTSAAGQDEEAVAPASTTAPAIAVADEAVARDPDAAAKARGLFDALGGRQNIEAVNACAVTRLRVAVRSAAAVDEKALTAAGASGVMHVAGPALHVIVGPHAAEYAEAMQSQLG